jgi:hypothetical protein
MSTTASPSATPSHRSHSGESAVRRSFGPRRDTAHRAPPGSAGQDRTPATLFQVQFASSMDDSDTDVLARMLNLVMHMHPKTQNSPASLGVTRLDFDSGLFLNREPGNGRWMLEGRTWGHPSSQAVREWYLRAAAAAHRLDPTVALRGQPSAPIAPRRSSSGVGQTHCASAGNDQSRLG